MQYLEAILSDIENNRPFSMAKLNHGFWEYRVKVEDRFGIAGYCGPEPTNEELDKFHQEIQLNFSAQFMGEVKSRVQSLPQKKRLSFFASVFSWRNCWNTERTPYCGIDRAMQAMRNYLHPETAVGNGLFWKEVTYDNWLHLFIEKIRDRRVIVVGPKYTEFFSEFARIKDSVFVEVSGEEAYKQRQETLQKLQAHYEASIRQSKMPFILFECGDLVSLWLIASLYESCAGATMIDLGQVLNLCNLAYLEGRNWFTQHRVAIMAAIDSINPEWVNDGRSYWKVDALDRSNEGKSHLVAAGIDLKLYPSVKKILDECGGLSAETRCSFVENKKIDYTILSRLLAVSQARNHWANFGPVVEMLELALAEFLKLPVGRKVVFCKSGTSALYALVGVEEFKLRRKMKWAISAFGFFSTRRGPLSDALVVDCDQNGLISLAELDTVKNEIDGIIVTNTFGLHNDWLQLIRYCDENSLVLIYDNATALWGPDRTVPNAPNEIVSFHQTKPWGLGEAGFAVLDSSDETTFKAILNFGVGAPAGINQYSGNEKLSDYDAALVLQRLLTMPRWVPAYQLQQRRISKIALECGLKIFNNSPNTVTNSVAVLMDHPISHENIANDVISLNKYYRPLEAGHANADDLYSRIVNIPCHPEIANIAEAKIRKTLCQLGSKADLPADHGYERSADNNVQYVFITGCSRSGTSFMADLFRNHLQVAMGRERFAARYFGKDFDRRLFSAERFCTLLKDGDSHHRVLDEYYGKLAPRFPACRVVGDKIPEISLDFTTLLSVFPDVKVVFLLRNIFDVASSFNARAMLTKKHGGAWPMNRNYRSAVAEWNIALENILERMGDPRFFVVEYEFFFRKPTYLMDLFAFAGLEVTPEVTSGYESIKQLSAKIETDRETYLSPEQKNYISRHARFDLYSRVVNCLNP